MLRVLRGGFERGLAVVNQLLARAAGDGVILDPGERPHAVRRQMRAHVVEVQIEADVAVEVAVARVAGIALVFAPDLLRGIEIAPEGRDAVLREDGREHAVARARLRVQQAMRVHDEPADVRLLQHMLHAIHVGALGQPDAARVLPEAFAVMIARGQDLRADGRRMRGQQRQQSMRRRRGDDFQFARVLKLAERADEIAVIAEIILAQPHEPLVIEEREFVIRAVPVGAVNFLFSELDQSVEMLLVAVLQEPVAQHGAERGREADGEARFHAVAQPALENFEQRQIRFRDGLEQPVLLEKLGMLRMPHKRQMRVQDEREMALHEIRQID